MSCRRLNLPKRYVHEQLLATIAIIAAAAQHYFSKYYDTLVLLLLHELAQLHNDDWWCSLKTKCNGGSIFIALAIEREQVNAYAAANLQQLVTTDDNPIMQFLEWE